MVHAPGDIAEVGAAWDRLRRPIWLYNPRTGRKPYANPAALALWSSPSLEEFQARDFSARSPAIQARIRRLADLTADGASVSERWTFFPQGVPSTTQATISGFRTAEGEDLLLFEAAPEDVPEEERRAVEALRHASAVIGVFAADGVCLFANPAGYRAYGGDISFEARFADPGEGAALFESARGEAVAGLRAVNTRLGPRWHHVDARPVLDPVTGLSCVLLNEQDVTLRVEAEMARSAAEQKAAMADARQRFLTDMSHELRTPLNAVIGFSHLLSEAGLEAEARDHVSRIHTAGEALLEVVNRMIASPPGEDEAAPPAAARVAPAWADAEPLGHSAPSGDGAGLRALYVDDNESNRTLVRAMLAAMGIACETANDGREGLEAAAAGEWDVILMDIQMPVMDGVTATRHIRALSGPAAAIPIIALTANTLSEQVESYFAAGMDDCLAKPVNMAELGAKTAHWARCGWRQSATGPRNVEPEAEAG